MFPAESVVFLFFCMARRAVRVCFCLHHPAPYMPKGRVSKVAPFSIQDCRLSLYRKGHKESQTMRCRLIRGMPRSGALGAFVSDGLLEVLLLVLILCSLVPGIEGFCGLSEPLHKIKSLA